MKRASGIFAFVLSLVAVSASAGLWDSIKKVGSEAVSTTVGIATTAAESAADAAVGQSAERAAETSENVAESAQTVVPSVSTPPAPSAPAADAPRPSNPPVRTSAQSAAVVPQTPAPSAPAADAPSPSASPVRASAQSEVSSAEAEREAYYAAERKKREVERREEERRQAEFVAKRKAEYEAAAKKREAERREEERRQAEFVAKRKAEYEAAAKKREAERREEERRQAEFVAKREAEYEAAAKRQAAMRAERERQEAAYAKKRRAEAEARRKAYEEERRLAREKAEREAQEARERAARKRVEKAFAFHQKAHAEAAGNPGGYVYKPVAFWDGVKLSMTEAEAYAALTNANSSLPAWTTNDVQNGAGWFNGTMRTVQLPVGELNLTFAASEATGIRLLIGADASFTNATNAVSAADVSARFAGLENVVSKKNRVAIDWTWKDGVNDFWHMLYDEVARSLEASKKSGNKAAQERWAHDLETIRAEFMNAVYEVTDTFTVDGIVIRVVSAEANGAVRLVTVKDVALGKAFGETTGGTAHQ